MNYGLSYKGSKSRIAKWVVEALPSADVWIELLQVDVQSLMQLFYLGNTKGSS